MRPVWRIEADGKATGGALDANLVRLQIRDEAGFEADQLSLTVSNQEGVIEPPKKGARLKVSLGFAETGLVEMGEYTVDAVTTTGPARVIEIEAAAVDLRVAAKAVKTREWPLEGDAVTLKDIVETIAGENGLTARVAADLGAIEYEHLSQSAESDLHFLTRIALEIGAVAKVAGGNLIVAHRGRGETVTGETLPVIALALGDFSAWSATEGERDAYAACECEWHDHGAAERRKVLVGEGEPVHRLRRAFPTEPTARRAATAALARLNRATHSLSGDLAVARLDMAAEQPVAPSGLDPIADQNWITTSVVHTLDGALTTSFEAEALEDQSS